MDCIVVDGSQGEGGGQILRSSLSLALCTGQPVVVESIRANRPNPGLARQHLACVQAAAAISGGKVAGDALGSTRIELTPGPVKGGEYRFDVQSAGSVTLLLQTLLPPLMLAPSPSHLFLSGGTHNAAAPPANYLQEVFFPLLERMGVSAKLTLLAHGFYPHGGGELEVGIEPTQALRPLQLDSRGARRSLRASVLVANLPRHIGERELNVLRQAFDLDEVDISTVLADGPGNVIQARAEFEHLTEMFTGFGEKKKRAEAVARGVADGLGSYLRNDVAVGPNLADQLLIPMALAKGGSFTTGTPTRHTLTNIAVIERFFGPTFLVESEDARRTRISVRAV